MVHPEPFIGVVEDIVDSGGGAPPAQSSKGTARTGLAQKLRIGKQGEQGFMPQPHGLDQDEALDDAESDQESVEGEPGLPVVEGLLPPGLIHPSVVLRSVEEVQDSVGLVSSGDEGLGSGFHSGFSFVVRIGIAACSR